MTLSPEQEQLLNPCLFRIQKRIKELTKQGIEQESPTGIAEAWAKLDKSASAYTEKIFIPRFTPCVYRNTSKASLQNLRSMADLQIDFLHRGIWEGSYISCAYLSERLFAKVAEGLDAELYTSRLREAGIHISAEKAHEHYLAAGFLLDIQLTKEGFTESQYLAENPDACAHRRATGQSKKEIYISGFLHYLDNVNTGRARAIKNTIPAPKSGDCKTPDRLDHNDDWLTRPVALEKAEMYEKLTSPAIRAVTTKTKGSIIVSMHSMDRRIIFGGLSAFYKFLNEFTAATQAKRLDFIVTDVPDKKTLENQISEPGHPINNDNLAPTEKHYHTLSWDHETKVPLHHEDILIAYNAKSAYACQALLQSAPKKIKNHSFLYFIQEDESIFHENNSFSAAIKSSYSLDSIKIVNSDRLHLHLRSTYPEDFGKDTHVFEHKYIRPTHTVYHLEKKNRIVAYFRPEAHAARNCAEIILSALNKFIAACSERDTDLSHYEFIGVGSFRAHQIELARGMRLNVISKMTHKEYSGLMSKSLVGISLMNAPHPSVVPFEMAAHGMHTVTNVYANRDGKWLTEKSEFIHPCRLNSESVCQSMLQAHKDAEIDRLRNKTTVGIEAQDTRQAWQKEFDTLSKALLANLSSRHKA